MRRASRKDKQIVVDILSCQFLKVPGTTWMLRKGPNLKYQIRTLAKMAFEKALSRKGVYISSNYQGIALCYNYHEIVFSLRELLIKLWFALTAVKWNKFIKMIMLERYKRKQRPASGKYFYFWFFAVLKGGQDAGFELKNEIFEMALLNRLPIYAETTMFRNKLVYERYGFKTYHYWEDPRENLQIWFLYYDPFKP